MTELVTAQRRVAEGTFGTCEVCGEEIPPGRVQARPEATRCVPCLGAHPTG